MTDETQVIAPKVVAKKRFFVVIDVDGFAGDKVDMALLLDVKLIRWGGESTVYDDFDSLESADRAEEGE